MATRNRYAEIMAQYAQSQPFSFTGIPSSYYGGQSGYTGGYDVTPYTPYVAPVNRYAQLMAQPAMGGGGGRGMPEAPSAWSQMTPAERAAYYAANPTEGKIALGMQDLFGNATLLGNAAKYFGADGWYDSRLEKQGYNPESFAYGPPDPNFSSQAAAAARNEALQEAITAANAEGAGLAANLMSRDPSQGGGRGGEGGGAATGGRDTGGGARDASGGGDRGTRGGFAKGGYVSMQRLQGPNPEGPDDGYAALKDGEFVINDKAVKKYGIELMQAINSGKISKGKLRGLLEM
jgi:hypothetical protein